MKKPNLDRKLFIAATQQNKSYKIYQELINMKDKKVKIVVTPTAKTVGSMILLFVVVVVIFLTALNILDRIIS